MLNQYFFKDAKNMGIVIAALAVRFGVQCKIDTMSGYLPYRITLLNCAQTEIEKIGYFIAGMKFILED